MNLANSNKSKNLFCGDTKDFDFRYYFANLLADMIYNADYNEQFTQSFWGLSYSEYAVNNAVTFLMFGIVWPL